MGDGKQDAGRSISEVEFIEDPRVSAVPRNRCLYGRTASRGGRRQILGFDVLREVGQISYWKHNHATLFRMPLDLKKELVTETPIRVLN